MTSQDHLTQGKSYIAFTNVDLEKPVHHQINICTVWWIQVTVIISTLINDITDQLNDEFYEKQIIKYDFQKNIDLIDLLTVWSTRISKRITIDFVDSTTIWYAFQKKSRSVSFKNQSKRFVCDNSLKKHQKWRNFRNTTRCYDFSRFKSHETIRNKDISMSFRNRFRIVSIESRFRFVFFIVFWNGTFRCEFANVD